MGILAEVPSPQPYGVHAGLVRYCPCQTRRDAAPTITTTGA